MFTVESNIPFLEKKIDRIKILVDQGWQKDSIKVMKQAVAMLKILTPRSKGDKVKWKKAGGRSGGMSGTAMPHLADGWTLRTIGGGSKDRVPLLNVVYNKYATDQTGKRKMRAIVGSGGSGPYTVLDILEFGSRAHVITPGRIKWGRAGRSGGKTGKKVGSNVLVFTSSTGEKVFTKRVDHPGTKAYGMVRLTRARLPALMRVMNIRWAKKIERIWGKK